MNKFLYFAYGSNMLSERLQARCPSAQAIGHAVASGHDFDFSKRSKKDGSGKATLVVTGHRSQQVHGVLFEIEKTDLRALDKAEGKGYGYDRHDDFGVTLVGNASTVTSATYIAPLSDRDEQLLPFDWYHALVVGGAEQHGLPQTHIDRLHAHSFITDPQSDRLARIEALAALSQAGLKTF